MTTIDLIALQRRRYLASPKSPEDWFNYITNVERLRVLEGHEASSAAVSCELQSAG